MKNQFNTLPAPTFHRRAQGFSLIEMLVATAIASVLFVVMCSTIIITSKGLPNANDPAVLGFQATQAADQIASDVESALYISQLTATSIAMTVADRDGDGIPERIGYSWSGTPGAPLLRTYNNGSTMSAVDAVDSFNVVSNVQYVTEQYPGPAVEDAAPSLLEDLTATSGLGQQSFGSSNATNFGQFFLPSFTSDVVGWRATSLTFKAMKNRTPGSFRVQVRPASATMLPTSTVLAEQLVDSTTLTTVQTPYTYYFSSLPRLSAGDGICLALMWESGQGPAKLENNDSDAGLLKTSGTATNWSYGGGNCLSTQVYGVTLRSGPTQTATTQYLLTLGISIRPGTSTAPTVQTSALALNHPELVGGLWELKFDCDPTRVDVNGDGQTDWALSSGATFNVGSLSASGWTSSSDTLLSAPGNDFTATTVVDLRMQSKAIGATAGFAINACRSGSQCVPLTAALVLQTDGTQVLTIGQKLSDASSAALISVGGVPAGAADVHLLIDPVAMGVAVSINGVQRGTFSLTRASVSDQSRACSLFASGGSVSFSYARVRILKAFP